MAGLQDSSDWIPAAPVLAGLDKFFHLLCNWDQYLAPGIAQLSPIGGHALMQVVGVVEFIAGILVAIKPKIVAPIVGLWLCLIILNLITTGSYLDVALRGLGLALDAFAHYGAFRWTSLTESTDSDSEG